MGSIGLTAAAVEKINPPKTGRKDVYDTEVPGLVLRLPIFTLRAACGRAYILCNRTLFATGNYSYVE